ncbi:unnamed protein product, partial [marine sediment metagenome]
KQFKNLASPEIIIHSLNFQEVIDQKYYIVSKIVDIINSLQYGGADFVIAACNSLHLIYDEVIQKKISIPWISIVNTTVDKIVPMNLHRIGLLGTSFTMQGKFYQKYARQQDIKLIVPPVKEQVVIDRIIYNELCRGIVKSKSRQILLSFINSLVINSDIEGIILGCTELPNILTQNLIDIPVFDTTQLHVEKAFRLSLEDEIVST